MTATSPIHIPLKRIVTCQGSIQLVTALSVLFYREQEQSDSPAEYENYLVIYDLYAPPGQIDQFVAFIAQMAIEMCPWKAIVYITPEQMQEISGKLNSTAPKTIFNLIHRWVGTATADEIYLCRNWQLGNQLLLNAYNRAEKICYGDSIGIYFSATSSVVPQVTQAQTKKTEPSSFHTRLSQSIRLCRFQAGMFLQKVRQQFGLYTLLKSLEFDQGYFILPTIMGEAPPMPTVEITPATLLNIFQKLTHLVNVQYAHQLRAQLEDAPVSVLLTSNLSEATRLSRENEILAYRRFLCSQPIESDTILVIKPHPRDDIAKLNALKEELSDLFSKIVVLSEPELFFLPFEIFFLSVLVSPQTNSKTKVFAVSSACLSLKLLFNVTSFVGFGSEITSSLFDSPHVAARLEHEQILDAALQHLKILPVI